MKQCVLKTVGFSQASEELYISGRSSDSYQTCVVDEEMVVPDWLFHVVSQHTVYDMVSFY